MMGNESVAERLGCAHVNTGAMYRAVTWFAMDRGLAARDCAAVARALQQADIRIAVANGKGQFLINGTDAETVAQLSEVTKNVSVLAQCPEVREILVRYQRRYACIGDVVMEGRDIGSVVFPETPWKYFIDASAEERQRRREAQGLSDTIRDRDRLDTFRASSPLKQAEGALRIDSTGIEIEEVVECILRDLAWRGYRGGRERRG
jgi:cytidylate kinase